MNKTSFVWLTAGLAVGVIASWLILGQTRTAVAGNDRHQDYIIATGPIIKAIREGDPELDGIWLLDYRTGKLLGTVIDGKGLIQGWAEVDLVKEFDIAPRENVHFLMTTGTVGLRAVLYVAETTTGKFGVYTLGSNGQGGFAIRKHDMVLFRQQQEAEGKK